jgi:hypothetical protein
LPDNDFDFDFATGRVATGADLPYDNAAAGDRLAAWTAAGITHVIDNRVEANDAEFVALLAPEVAYLHNPADDAGQRMPDAWFDRGVAFALDALAQPGATPETVRHADRRRVAAWRAAHPLDVVRIIADRRRAG